MLTFFNLLGVPDLNHIEIILIFLDQELKNLYIQKIL